MSGVLYQTVVEPRRSEGNGESRYGTVTVVPLLRWPSAHSGKYNLHGVASKD